MVPIYRTPITTIDVNSCFLTSEIAFSSEYGVINDVLLLLGPRGPLPEPSIRPEKVEVSGMVAEVGSLSAKQKWP